MYTKSKKMFNVYIYTKRETIFKKQDNLHYVFIYKKPDTLRYAIFIKLLKLAFIYTKTIKLCVMLRFILKKKRHFEKTKTIWVTFIYIYKASHFALREFSWYFWNWRRRGGDVKKKKCTSVKFQHSKNNALSVRFLYTKILTLRVTFLYKKTIHFALRFISKIYREIYSQT